MKEEAVMFVRVTSTPKSPRKSVKVVASVRHGFKVKQKMLLHVGVASNDGEIEKLKQLGREFIAAEQLRREKESPQLSFFEPEEIEERLELLQKNAVFNEKKKRGRKVIVRLEDVTREDQLSLADLVEEQRLIEGIHEVAGHVYDQMGYAQIFEKEKEKNLLKDLVLMRLASPASKLKTQQILDKRFAKTHEMDRLYRLMDKLFPKIPSIKSHTFERTRDLLPGGLLDLLFFDCTTLYFESTTTDELRQFGYSKDHRFNTTQVVLALATNKDGLPVGYELFEGNKAEVKTLLSCLASWKQTLPIGSVCFVADRAMMSDENLSLLEQEGHTYVVAAKLRNTSESLKEALLDEKNYQPQIIGEEFGWVGEFSYKGRRLVVSYKTARAGRDSRQRQQVLDKIKKKIGKKGKTQTLITNQGVKKYTSTQESMTTLAQDKIEADSQWDGLHGVITNIATQKAAAILARYSRLWKIEESFRLNKHTLSMRPIYHFKPERIHAHIALCYMAFSVLRHLEYRVQLTQKVSPQVMIEELMNVQASIYRHVPSGKRYRMPGQFSHTAAKIYKAFQLTRKNNAQVFSYT